jgi:dienelactone hydrolase
MKRVSNFAALLLAVLLVPAVARAAIQTKTVEYKDGDATLKGFLAWDDSVKNARPGILVVPEWWGLNDYVKNRAKQLAELGYVAFVADIYGEGFVTSDPKVAGEKAGNAKSNNWLRTRGKLALEQLKKSENVDPNNVAAIGYCFGGGCVLEMARAGDDLKGVVSFHGSLDTKQPAQKDNVKPKVLVLTGEADPFVPADQVRAVEKEFKDAGADIKVVGYPGAKHAFTNPDADKYGMPPVSYNKEADEKSWQEMKDFFARIFGDANPKPAAAAAAK